MSETEPIIDLGSDEFLMGEALRLAQRAAKAGEVPVGAVILHKGRIIARAWNQVEQLKDPTAHAEILAITQAANVLEDWRLNGCDLYVTKEPCPMCAGALVHARIRRVIFGLPDPKGGGAGGLLNILQLPELNHQCQITSGVRHAECLALLQGFFQERRRASKNGEVSPGEDES
jgi:tRNA(adenine34) deaminase